MPKVYSKWKLTLNPAGTPFVILAFDDLIDDELRISMAKGMEVIPLVDSSSPFLQHTRNAYYQLKFTVYHLGSDDDDARVEMMNFMSDFVDTRGKQELRLEIQGRAERYYQFDHAIISGFEPVREIQSARARYGTTYDITATGFNKVII